MPAWVNSDHLTVLGFLSLLGAGAAYTAAAGDGCWLHVVNLCLVVNWFGDSTDGTLARVRNRQRPRYGFYVDHVVDAVGTLCLLGGMGLSGYMSASVAAGLIIAYFLLSIETYLATYTIGTFHLSFGGMSPTELRILLVIGNLYLLFRPSQVHLLGHHYLLFDVGGVVGIAGLASIALYQMVRHAVQLYREERLPE
ncbi:MAG: CDP-alcohol phosphatidyltransferase family protein [Acidobacteria bacterium]|nr:CDP-alcohol phosphatidyltransferase family protein [Acidobacteriota bacterium]